MKRWAYWLCALLAAALAAWLLYRYGVSLPLLLLVLLLLVCPFFVVWLSLYQARQAEGEIAAATRRELERRAQSKPSNKP
jgi:O-antigen/teichoic acid export membrane protein